MDNTVASNNGIADLLVRPMAGQTFAAEVIGLVTTDEPTPEHHIRQIRQALLDYRVIAIRNLDSLTPVQHIEFTRRFGEAERLIIMGQHPEHPEIIVMSNEKDENGKKLGIAGLPKEMSKDGRSYWWHSDQQFKAIPSMGSLLHAKRLPECGDGDTVFCDLIAAYDSLDDETKAKIEGLRAGTSISKNVKPEYLFNADQQKMLDKMPEVLHPVVRTHPETGRKALYISEGFTTKIEGMDPEESDALLQRLFLHQTQPERIYSHKWKKGDLVFWDNRCTLHLATGSQQPRTLYRTTVGGTVPV